MSQEINSVAKPEQETDSPTLTEQLDELWKKIEYHNDLYYNSTPEISDEEYDDLVQNYRDLFAHANPHSLYAEILPLKTYRLEFGLRYLEEGFWKGFGDLPRRYYVVINRIFQWLEEEGIKYRWFFFEPYVEITWLMHPSRAKKTIEDLREFLSEEFTMEKEHYQIIVPAEEVTRSCSGGLCKTNGKHNFGDWFCQNEAEKFFGCISYAKTSEIAMAYANLGRGIDQGYGLRRQYQRRLHSLANQLGYHYGMEGWLCFQKGIFCLLVRLYYTWPFVQLQRLRNWIAVKIFRKEPKAALGNYWAIQTCRLFGWKHMC